MAEERLVHRLRKVKQESQEPQKIRGMEISEISSQEVARQKAELEQEDKKLQIWTACGIITYFLFFGGLYYLLLPFKENIIALGYGIQALLISLSAWGINKLSFMRDNNPYMRHRGLLNMLLAYSVFCLIIIFVSLNHLDLSIFTLTE